MASTEVLTQSSMKRDEMGLILVSIGLGGFLPLGSLLCIEINTVDLRHSLANFDAGIFNEGAGHG